MQRVFLWTFVGMGLVFMLIGLGVGAVALAVFAVYMTGKCKKNG